MNDRDGIPKMAVNATSMPKENILEMVADWKAVSQERGTNIMDWYSMNIGKRWKFTKIQCSFMLKCIELLK